MTRECVTAEVTYRERLRASVYVRERERERKREREKEDERVIGIE